MRRLMLCLAILAVSVAGARGQPTYFEVPDVPTDLPTPGPTFLPWSIVLNAGGAYAPAASLPANTPVDALYRLPPGGWLVSVEATTTLGGIDWEPRDVFRWNGGALFAPFAPYAGAVAQIPVGSNVDAAFLDTTGFVVVSFDVPTTIGPITYDPADLVRYNGITFDAAPYFDASAAGIPATTNLTAADRRGFLTLLSLDVPTTVGLPTFLPGEILSWNGGALALYDPQPGWPANRSSRVNALTFDPVVPGANAGEIPLLTVEHLGVANLRLRWTAADCEGAQDTGIYQGSIAAFPAYDHTEIVCTDGFPFLQEDIPLPPGDAYFLVVPHNGVAGEEGSYGQDNLGGVMAERPIGFPATCQPVQALGCP